MTTNTNPSIIIVSQVNTIISEVQKNGNYQRAIRHSSARRSYASRTKVENEQAGEWLENAFVFYITKLNMVDSDTYPITDPLSIIATVRRVRKERNKKKKAEAAARKEGK